MVRGQRGRANKPLSLKAKAEIHNRFDVEVIDGTTGKVKQEAVAYNIILDAMWARLLSAKRGNWFAAISYGSGTGTLSAARTDLFTRIGTKATGSVTADISHWDDGYKSYRKSIQIGAGEITGQTVREVGISYDTNAGHLMTHALLQDMNGNTVSITVGELDVINIYATVYVRFTAGGFLSGKVWFSKSSTLMACLAGCLTSTNNWTAYYPIYLHSFSGEVISEHGVSATYKTGLVSTTPAEKSILCQWSLDAGATYRIGVNDLNLPDAGGWRGVTLGYSNPDIYIQFPNSAKAYCSITDEAVGAGDGATTSFDLDFGFLLNDSSLVVKLDGVTVDPEDYTVLYGLPATNRIWYFLQPGDLSRTRDIWLGTGGVAQASDYDIVENPFYASIGITSIQIRGFKVEVSNDLETWVQVASDSATYGLGTVYDISATYQKYRYWKISYNVSSPVLYDVLTSDTLGNRIIFDTPPANGVAVTASYRTENICKDTNHVVDLELELTLNEYTGS